MAGDAACAAGVGDAPTEAGRTVLLAGARSVGGHVSAFLPVHGSGSVPVSGLPKERPGE